MTKTQFKSRLSQLHEVFLKGQWYYAIWIRVQFCNQNEVDWSLAQQNSLLKRHSDFFKPVALALQQATLLQFAKVFDKNARTSSLPVLLRAARRDPKLVPNCSPQDLRSLSAKLDTISETRKKLQRLRDQRLAHMDANPLPRPRIKKGDLDVLVRVVGTAFNKLSVAHDKNVYDWWPSVQQVGEDTVQVMGVLMTEKGS